MNYETMSGQPGRRSQLDLIDLIFSRAHYREAFVVLQLDCISCALVSLQQSLGFSLKQADSMLHH